MRIGYQKKSVFNIGDSVRVAKDCSVYEEHKGLIGTIIDRRIYEYNGGEVGSCEDTDLNTYDNYYALDSVVKFSDGTVSHFSDFEIERNEQ